MPARALMIGGTASHVGKSWMATAICRWLYRRGVRVAPFKAQNMSNNSYPCRDGGEIGRAQVAQAQACGLDPVSDMNPILLKPCSESGSQVIVQGRVWRHLSAREYLEARDVLEEKVHASYERLASEYEVLVVEGAGSIAELNLRQTDIVNTGLACHFGIPILLVADIDRGGIFGALYGTISLLTPAERALVRATAVNRFRGDPSLFLSGVQLLQEKTGKPCLGVFPYAPAIELDEEDSVSIGAEDGAESEVAIVRFPRISNHTDFRLLPFPCWIDAPLARTFKTVILPGTKSTMSDLAWLRSRGLDQWILRQHEEGATILGICGGYQMLGSSIEDPDHSESEVERMEGLNLLPVTTVLQREKTVQAVEAQTRSGVPFGAYEIHVGQTSAPESEQCFAYVGGQREGLVCNRCIGTYLHGAFENCSVLLESLGIQGRHSSTQEENFDRLADWFANAADLPLFEKLFLS